MKFKYKFFPVVIFLISAMQVQARDLTGEWECVMQTTGNVSPSNHYYVREVKNKLFWFGEDMSHDFPTWSNVASGEFDGHIGFLIWADTPKGSTNRNHGTVAIARQSDNKMDVVYQSGGFGCTQFLRK